MSAGTPTGRSGCLAPAVAGLATGAVAAVVVGAVWWALVLGTVRRFSRPVAVGAGLLGSLLLVWGVVALLGVPGSYPTDTCPSAWWAW